jgi:peptidylprolyl isomerase/peptidyl-prolyl cis-trans isomerase A (cyclophilin A)
MSMPRTALAFVLASSLSAPLAGAAEGKTAKPAAELYAVFETSRGKIGVKLLPGEAPNTVANFVDLATGKKQHTDPVTGEKKSVPYFDGTLFHRVIPQFMIQGGDPATRGAAFGATSAGGKPFGVSGPGYQFEDELPKPGGPPLFAKPCVLAMANAGPNTNGSQFFITEGSGAAVGQLEPRACGSPSGVCGYTRFGEGVCGCQLVADVARAGNSQTRLVKVIVTSTPPTCK